MNIGTQSLKGRLTGSSMFDEQGKEWVRKTANEQPSAPAAPKRAIDTSFSNADVVKLVEAKLPR